MIAKISHGSTIMGALLYNFQKVDIGKGAILHTQNICQAPDGGTSPSLAYRSFEPYLLANRNTEKPSLHISINPDPRDNVDDGRYLAMASEYMNEMGYGSQPFLVFKHTDIERTHIHIVSINVDGQGKKISDAFEHKRSMAVCRALEHRYGLRCADKGQEDFKQDIFRPVDCTKPDIKHQIAAVVRYLPEYYSYQSIGAYNAILSLFNITVQEVTGELNGSPRQGLVYFALDTEGNKAGHPIKASRMGPGAGHAALLSHFDRSNLRLKDTLLKSTLKNTIELAMHSSKDENDFKTQLKEQGINVVPRRNSDGRIYGITFVDHCSRSVWNGSQLSKGLSANVFEQWWSKANSPLWNEGAGSIGIKYEMKEQYIADPAQNTTLPDRDNQNMLEGIMGLLMPGGYGEDPEELEFARRIRKKKRKK